MLIQLLSLMHSRQAASYFEVLWAFCWDAPGSVSVALGRDSCAASLAYLHLLRGEPGQSSSSFSLKLKGKTSLLPWMQQNDNKHSFVGLTNLQIKGGPGVLVLPEAPRSVPLLSAVQGAPSTPAAP